MRLNKGGREQNDRDLERECRSLQSQHPPGVERARLDGTSGLALRQQPERDQRRIEAARIGRASSLAFGQPAEQRRVEPDAKREIGLDKARPG